MPHKRNAYRPHGQLFRFKAAVFAVESA